MRTYTKIDTAFDRDERFRVDTARLRRPVFGTIAWLATEKVNGTNIRLGFRMDHELNPSAVYPQIAGRTENASLHPRLLAHCQELVARIAPGVMEIMREHGLTDYMLVGEGYGAKIQDGGGYRQDPAFILFDVLAGDKYLADSVVTATGVRLDIPRVPILNGGEVMTLGEITEMVSQGFPSLIAETPGFLAEGIVARPVEPLHDNRDERIILKLKGADFRAKGKGGGYDGVRDGVQAPREKAASAATV